MDTLGTEKQSGIQRFPLFRGYFVRIAIFLGPQKLFVIQRFSLLGDFVIRDSTVYSITALASVMRSITK